MVSGNEKIPGDGEQAMPVAADLAELPVCGVERVRVATGEDDARAFGQQRLRDGATNAARRAGDEADLISETKIHSPSVVGPRGL